MKDAELEFEWMFRSEYPLSSEGTASRFVFEYLRAFPGRAEAVFLDSPWFPDVDPRSAAIDDTRSALEELFRACADDPSCAEAYPDLHTMWESAIRRLSRRPLHGEAPTSDGDLVAVTIDAGKLLRVARYALGGDGPENLTRLPAMISAAAEGEIHPLLGELVASDQLYCLGYRPFCDGQDGFALGVYLTSFCGELTGSPDLTADPDDPRIYEEVFVRSPYVEACGVWNVPPAEDRVHEPVVSDVPMLFLAGQFDSFSRPDVARRQATRLPAAWAIEVPGQTHNVLGFHDCLLSIRNAWTFAPSAPPVGLECLEDMPAPAFST